MTRHLFGTHFGLYETDDSAASPGLRGIEEDPNPTAFGRHYLALSEHAHRIARPMIRRGWLAGDERSRRGSDRYVAVDWETALSHVAAELTRVSQTHGNRAIYAGSYGWASAGRFHHAQSQLKRLLNLAGGYTDSRHSYSYGTAGAFLPHVLGMPYAGTNACAPSWDQVAAHTDCLIAFGLRLTNAQCDPGGVARHTVEQWLGRALDRGMRLVVVSPDAGDVPRHPNAEHIALRPNTDTALLLACAHRAVATGRVDHEALARQTVGHERFIGYLVGDTDGQAKDAAWASTITGASITTLERVFDALDMDTVLLNLGWSLQRASAGEQPYWAAIALAAIRGQIGRPGGGFAFGLGSVNSVGQPVRHLRAPGVNQGTNPVGEFIPVAAIAELLDPNVETLEYNGQTLVLPDIRLVYWAGGNPFHHHQDLNRLQDVWQHPETVVVHEPVWSATARHADIVLPTTLPFERNDLVVSSQDRSIAYSRAVRPPFGQARDDHDICAGLAQRLGQGRAFTGDRTKSEWLADLYAGYCERFDGLPSFETLKTEGLFTLDAEDEAPATTTLLAAYAEDPERYPLETPSGRIELYSATIAAFDYADCPPHPAWVEPTEWLGGNTARTYPLHLLSPQPANRLHSQLDSVGDSQAAKIDGREVATFAAADATARGIAAGDTVRLFNDRGACLVGAAVCDTLMPGVVILPTGAWFAPGKDVRGRAIERAGNPNAVTGDFRASRLSQGSAANSCLVEAERTDSAHAPTVEDGIHE
ncbi:molybdopterin-dependent oxidoreductase [Salinisphaera sp. Q1T1-3]|uniref:molybdopterin-dependent oxidoreductase n=1 Tax=Salinisphaera sp. Q1T1-3 TaxID=2321229 RepID=UPI000E727DBD|nr:molybdopterin-dependent oxidoreductase [Salinisphaera sp. Q1T1-3]RJS95208.1 oxidoreductase [Salinisphaera sp. Q1T1-3]